MGIMIDGQWHVDEPQAKANDGRYQRATSPVRNWITPDGAPGPSGRGGYRAEIGRYHLYIAEV